MYDIKEYTDIFKMYELIDSEGKSSVKLAPERGGIISSFKINGQEIFYMDEERFYDISKYVWGGNPILFPSCGVLDNNEYEINKVKYTLGNHGFARDFKWEVLKTDNKDAASITIKLDSNEHTKKSYPFDFSLIFTYILKENKLTINQEYINNSDMDMPIYPGFHPYFYVEDLNKIKYDIPTKEYFDNKDMIFKYNSEDLKLDNLDAPKIFTNVYQNKTSFYEEVLNRKILIEYGESFKHIVLWSINKNFICVEPWCGKANSFNTKEDLIYVKPKSSLKEYISITIE